MKTTGTPIAVPSPPQTYHPNPENIQSTNLTLARAESDISEPSSESPLDETLLDRLAALADIVPPTTRKNISSVTSKGYSWASRALTLGGKTLWVVGTSALLLGVPWALAFSEEQQVQEMEREMRMQQSASEVS